MDIRARLIGLLEYTGRMASLSERAVFRLAEYRALVFHEQELRNRPGVHHDLVEDEERTWLRIDRLVRRDPPLVPEDVRNWLTVGRDPFRQPSLRATRVVTVKREEAEALVDSGRAKAKDVEPALRGRDGLPVEELRDVVLRLENDAEAQSAVRAYLEGPWVSWAEQEKPRRETIRIYEAFFSLQQAIETQGIERPLEVVWGVGVARWKHPRKEIDHPLVEQLVEIDIAADDGAIRIRSRSTEPVVVTKPFHELGIAGADKLQRFAREHFRELGAESELSPFISTTFEPVLRQAFSLLDPEGRYHPDQIEDLEDRTLPAAGPTLVVTDTWAIYARPRSANIVVEDIERLKARVEESAAEELPGTARRLVSLPDDTRPADALELPLQLGTGLAQRIGESTEPLGEESAFYFPKPFNDEQVEIVRRLEREEGVVVQGPPGTGKTHTIANINRNMTDLVRAALVMFVAAIRQIGAGTGIRARRFRRDARDAMDRSYAAVPCWIMPTWRVSESLPSIPGSFDLVIIDEASQSDVMALPAILRGQKVLVVGDDKQVSPVAVGVEEKKILQLRHNYLEGQPFAAMLLPGRSLYDLMGAIFPGQRIMLKEHFRCVEPIIQTSSP